MEKHILMLLGLKNDWSTKIKDQYYNSSIYVQKGTAEMLLICANDVNKIFLQSPLCILKDFDINGNTKENRAILEKVFNDDCEYLKSI